MNTQTSTTTYVLRSGYLLIIHSEGGSSSSKLPVEEITEDIECEIVEPETNP